MKVLKVVCVVCQYEFSGERCPKCGCPFQVETERMVALDAIQIEKDLYLALWHQAVKQKRAMQACVQEAIEKWVMSVMIPKRN